MGQSLSIGLADGLLPSPPGVDLQQLSTGSSLLLTEASETEEASIVAFRGEMIQNNDGWGCGGGRSAEKESHMTSSRAKILARSSVEESRIQNP